MAAKKPSTDQVDDEHDDIEPAADDQPLTWMQRRRHALGP